MYMLLVFAHIIECHYSCVVRTYSYEVYNVVMLNMKCYTSNIL